MEAVFLFHHLCICDAAAVKHDICWKHTFIILDQNLLRWCWDEDFEVRASSAK